MTWDQFGLDAHLDLGPREKSTANREDFREKGQEQSRQNDGDGDIVENARCEQYRAGHRARHVTGREVPQLPEVLILRPETAQSWGA